MKLKQNSFELFYFSFISVYGQFKKLL